MEICLLEKLTALLTAFLYTWEVIVLASTNVHPLALELSHELCTSANQSPNTSTNFPECNWNFLVLGGQCS